MLPQSNSISDQENVLLWAKIKDFSFDQPGTVITFTTKLASENGWKISFAQKVIEEYRKFIYLCCVSSTGTSPSKIVDKAWHLHLTYTKSYWIALCKNTLGKEVHHRPSGGGDVEKHTHQEWYKGTLALYEQVFGTAPPSDIWPRLEETINEIETPDFSPDARYKRLAYGLISLPFLFIAACYMNVFSAFLERYQFFIFFTLLVSTIFISALIYYHFRTIKIKAFIQTHFPANVTVFQLATFIRNKDRAVQTGIVDLINKGLLKLEEDRTFLVTNKDLLPDEQNPFVNQLLLIEDGTKVSYEEIDKNWYKVENFTHPVLESIEASIIRDTTPLDILIIFFIIFVVVGGVGSETEELAKGFIVLIVILCLILFILKLAFSRKHILLEEGVALYMKKLRVPGQQHDVTTNFAIYGKAAIDHLNNKVLLSDIFSARSSAQPPESSCGGCCG